LDLGSLGIRLGGKIECTCGQVHEIYTKKVLIDNDGIDRIATIIDELKLSGNALVVHDKITKEIAGNKLMQQLRQSGHTVDEYVMLRPTAEEVNNIHRVLRNFGYAVAVGGGSVIDTCKLATYKSGIPFLSVPTALSHDGVVSATASITSEDGSKMTITAHPPIAVIFDLKILNSQPRRMLASGCGDMLARATSLKDWELGSKEKGEHYCPTIAKLVLKSFDEAVKFIQAGGKDIASFSWAIFESGIAMAMAGSSRPNSGSEHIISHYIDMHSKNPAMHGEQVGIATILMSLYHSKHNPDWWTEEKYQWYAIRQMLKQMNAPTTLEELGVEVDVLISALNEGYKIRPERYTILHKRPVPRDEAVRLLKSTGLISD